MNKIHIEGLEKNIGNIILEDIQYIQTNLDSILKNSDKTTIKNLIKETKFLTEQAKDDLKTRTYQDKYIIFDKINKIWFDLHQHYRNSFESVWFIKTINHLTNYSIAYSQLFLSLSLINENKTGEYKSDLQQIVSGFLLLSETLDVFLDLFSRSELEQINYGAENAISISERNIIEYFEEDLELSNLVTQLRAYNSLIILRVKKYIDNINLQRKNLDGLEFQLKEMANDSEIQLEISCINEEFLVTEMDGLT